MAKGKAPVGFVNPLLYSLESDVFIDVVKGDNHCTAGMPPQINCCKYGFSATKGWDPIAGLGSINYAALRDAVLSQSTLRRQQPLEHVDVAEE